jgi:hypothetical protein
MPYAERKNTCAGSDKKLGEEGIKSKIEGKARIF